MTELRAELTIGTSQIDAAQNRVEARQAKHDSAQRALQRAQDEFDARLDRSKRKLAQLAKGIGVRSVGLIGVVPDSPGQLIESGIVGAVSTGLLAAGPAGPALSATFQALWQVFKQLQQDHEKVKADARAKQRESEERARRSHEEMLRKLAQQAVEQEETRERVTALEKELKDRLDNAFVEYWTTFGSFE